MTVHHIAGSPELSFTPASSEFDQALQEFYPNRIGRLALYLTPNVPTQAHSEVDVSELSPLPVGPQVRVLRDERATARILFLVAAAKKLEGVVPANECSHTGLLAIATPLITLSPHHTIEMVCNRALRLSHDFAFGTPAYDNVLPRAEVRFSGIRYTSRALPSSLD